MKENRKNSEIVYLGLGSNMGDRLGYLRQASQKICGHPSIEHVASSTILETPPVGYFDQPPFLNQVLKVTTPLTPTRLLKELGMIEDILGRKRERRWGPRTIDIDILTFGTRIVSKPYLQVPHPRLLERPFFIRMMAELDVKQIDPVSGLRFVDLIGDWGRAEITAAGRPYEDALCRRTGK